MTVVSGLRSVAPLAVRLSPVGKLYVALTASLRALKDPTRADDVAAVAETTAGPFLRRMLRIMQSDEDGRRILQERRRFLSTTAADPQRLSCLPAGSLGHEYYRYMSSNSFRTDARPPVRFVEDAELSYVMTRYREVHDLYHVLLGNLPPTVLAETAIKLCEWQQTGLPSALLSAVAAPFFTLPSAEERQIFFHKVVPWVSAHVPQFRKNMLCIPYEDILQDGVDEIRARYNIVPMNWEQDFLSAEASPPKP